MTVLIKESREHGDVADAGGTFEIERRPTLRKTTRGCALPVCQTSNDGAVTVTGLARLLDVGASREQQLQQRNLHARVCGMHARRRETERRAVTAIRLRPGVDVSAAVEQQLGNRHD